MSKNQAVIYRGIAGFFCECGNAEVITDEHQSYDRFGSWWDTSGGRGTSKVTCRKCNSDVHEPQVYPQPSNLTEKLQLAYPGVDVVQLLTQCAVKS